MITTESDKNIKYAETLSKMIQCETISVYGNVNAEKFTPFHELLKELFPTLFSKMTVENLNGSLLMKWAGRSSEKPILFMSHHDVVEATGTWKYPAFSGEIAEGKIWGRGTLDTKNNLWAMLTAGEELAEKGFVPENDIWFESACTEETDGSGAAGIVAELKKRKIFFEAVYDEGGYILHDPIGGADYDFAVVGVGEKGVADLKFVASSKGGHASMPGKNTPLVRLGKFMAEVEKTNKFEAKMNDVTKELFSRCSEYMTGYRKFLFSNINFFKPLLVKLLPNISNAAGAMLKTTVAFTMAGGSDGYNVLPEHAYVTCNMRFSHHQGKEKSFAVLEKIAKKYDIKMEIIDPGFASKISDFQSNQFKKVEKAVEKVFPNIKTVPYVMTGASDCRYFSEVSDNCFRFAPFKISDEQLDTIHGINENLDVCSLSQAVEFFRYLMEEN